MKNQKGFTIIELIVVIAIIAVLASIVMINVTSYIAKSKDASIKGNMTAIMSTAAAIYDTYASYTNSATNAVNGNSLINNAVSQINKASGAAVVVQNVAAAYCVCANLVSDSANVYCVDSTGFKGEMLNTTACSARCNSTTAVCH